MLGCKEILHFATTENNVQNFNKSSGSDQMTNVYLRRASQTITVYRYYKLSQHSYHFAAFPSNIQLTFQTCRKILEIDISAIEMCALPQHSLRICTLIRLNFFRRSFLRERERLRAGQLIGVAESI